MKKLVICTMLSLSIITSMFNLPVYSSTIHDSTYTITKQDELEKYIQDNNIQILDGYHLESVTYDLIDSENLIPEENITFKESKSSRIGESITNVKKVSTDIYFPSDAITSDYYDGPTISQKYTFTESVSAKITGNLGASNSGITASVGFDVTKSFAKSKEVTLPAIDSKKKLNVKVFGVYDKYSFDVYSLTGSFKGTEYAYKPMGLYIAQELYSK